MATEQIEQEQRVLLRHATWETYERVLAERGEDRSPRFTYDRGRLEIVSPLLPEHGYYSYNIEFLVGVLADELDMDITGYGPMTLKREDIEAGAEPDACFYIRNPDRVRGKRRIDLHIDPPGPRYRGRYHPSHAR